MSSPTLAFTPHQLSLYLDYISLPVHYSQYISQPASFPKTQTALTTLCRCHLTRFPYDNLSLHYSKTHSISIEPADTWVKFMGQESSENSNATHDTQAAIRPRGRGGYCMENSIFFYEILKGLGFDAYTTAVRIRYRGEDGVPAGPYIGYTHMVSIVTLPPSSTTSAGQSEGIGEAKKFAIDVAFGGDGWTSPMPLIPNYTRTNLFTQQIRLSHGNLTAQTQKGQKYWIYEYRNGGGSDMEWNAFYAFTELEHLMADFRVMNYFTSEAEASFQRWKCLVVRFLREGEVPGCLEGYREGVNGYVGGGGGNEEGDEVRIVGKVMLVGDKVKVNVDGKTKVVQVCRTERERVEALRKWFDMELNEEEIEGIKGWRTELVEKN